MNIKSILTACTFAAAIAFDAGAATAIDHAAYSHDSYNGAVNPKWLTALPDTLRLSQLSLPGTHDSMALYGGDIPQTQSMDLETQLNAGIRVLDIRCWHIANNFQIAHGIVLQNATFSDVLDTVDAFLAANPGETVVMRVKEENTGKNNTRSFADTFNAIASKYPGLFWTPNGTSNPTLGSVRGKVVMLQNFAGVLQGISYSSLENQGTVQDNYELKTNWDLYGKWQQVKSQIMSASTGDSNKIYLNYLSGATGAFPYFVASGHSSHETGAPQLMTGLTTLTNPNTYPDFPRVSCLGSLCSIAFLGTNQLSSKFIADLKTNYLTLNRMYQSLNLNIRLSKRVGIIMADFPGISLINNVIAMNR